MLVNECQVSEGLLLPRKAPSLNERDIQVFLYLELPIPELTTHSSWQRGRGVGHFDEDIASN